MKICLINNTFKPYDRGGGSERITEIIFDELKNEDHSVFTITTSPFAQKKEEHLKNVYYLKSIFLSQDKVPYLFRPIFHLINSIDIRRYFKIKSILKKERPNIIMTHNLFGLSFLVALLAKKLNIKHIHTLHDIQLLHPSGTMYYKKEKILDTAHAKIYQAINRIVFSSPDLVISPSNWLMNLHTEKKFFPKSKKIVLPNPMPKIEVSQNRESRIDIFKFLYVGQIEEHKGASFLVDVFKNLNKKYKNYELTIAGSGSKLEECKKLVKNNNKIKFLGKIPNTEIIKLMKDSNYLIVPSLCYDNSPTVIYEASANNTPVIASDIGGINELKKIADITLFEPNNIGNLLKIIKKILENKNHPTKKKQNDPLFLTPRKYIKKILEF